MGRAQAVLAVVALALAATAPVAGVPVASGLGQETVDPDAVVLTVQLEPDGDAAWTVEHRVRLSTDEETAAFEDVRADVAANRSTYEADFAARMGHTARTAENATGREMAIENVSVAAEQRALPQAYGVLTYRFRWTNFAAVDDDGSVRAGDALAGLFLDNETSLRIGWPDGYDLAEAGPTPDRSDDGEVVWHGPREFGRDEPAVAVAPAGDGDGGGGGNGLATAVGVGAVALVAAFVAVRRFGRPGLDGGGVDGASDADLGEAAGTDEDDAGGGEPAAPDESAAPPSELLSNEERVLQLLEENGGRLKQQQVAADLDWTAAKTSQVIGDMREGDAVETFRLGRENVVTLPDEGLGDDLGPEGGT